MSDSGHVNEMPKKYKFTEAEPRWVARWEELGIYRFNPESPAALAGRTFSVDTPPPYVSAAHLHVGHAMSYSQAEFVVRYKRMRGYEVFYPMGFDDNGLPTERYVEKKYKVHKGNISREGFVDLCLKETASGAKVYEDLWRSLGLSVDWRMTYSTINKRAVEHSQRSFVELARSGAIQRREDPILWDPRLGTSLAQADIEAGEEQNRPLHRLRFARTDGGDDGVIDTTRPELVTACVAIACNPEDPRFSQLSGDVRFEVPLTDLRADGTKAAARTCPLIRDEAVDPDFGTGLMMVCTFGDAEDIVKWRTHKLETHLVIDQLGKMVTPELPELHGKRVHVAAKGKDGSSYNEARLAARDLLDAHGYLLGIEENVSRASISDRSGCAVEFQVVPQWFIRVLDIKEELIARGREIKWHPPFMRDRYEDWVNGLKWDWNISRQRFYGVPFPVWYRSVDGVTPGDALWPDFADLPVDPLAEGPLPPSIAAQLQEGETAIPEEDVMDTWMTSSLTPLINANWAFWDKAAPADAIDLQPRPNIYPMGVRVQAFEIIRSWLFYSVVKSHLHTGSLPWKDVMISGWGLDRKGKKMSKRLGNFVDPATVIERYSADSLRYWSAGATLGHDLRYLEDDVRGGKRLLTKLWNSTRFAIMSIDDWAPAAAAAETPTAADRWIRSRIVDAIDQSTAAFEQYEYNKAVRATEALFWKDWCDNYLEIVKDRFRNPDNWQAGEVEAARRTIFEGTWAILRMFAPVLPFVTEELYETGLKPRLGDDAPASIHVAPWPVSDAGNDTFGGERDAAGEALGELLVDLVAAVRQLKTLAQTGLGTPVETVYVRCADDVRADVEQVQRDFQAAARAADVVFGAPDSGENEDADAAGAPTHQVGARSLYIGIITAPRET